MAERNVQVELEIFGRTFPITCTRSVRNELLQAAEKLDADLRVELSERNVSNKEMINHLVALALEYLCEMGAPSAHEETRMIQRVEAITGKLAAMDATLAES